MIDYSAFDVKQVEGTPAISIITPKGKYIDKPGVCNTVDDKLVQPLLDDSSLAGQILIFHMKDLQYMSTVAWDALLSSLKVIKIRKGDIQFAEVNPDIYETYKILELTDDIFKCNNSVPDAIKDTGNPNWQKY